MSSIRLALALLSVTTIVLASPVAVAGEGADGPKPGTTADADPFGYVPPEVRQKMAAQEPARTAASQIRWAVQNSGATGFSGIELDGGAVVLWFKGDLPESVRAAVESARADAPVQVRAARHSKAELEVASRQIAEGLRKQPGGPLHGVAIAMDGSGLVVAADRAMTRQAAGLPDVGVPVEVRAQDRPQLLARHNDVAPYWGGARVRNMDNYGQCTSGFGVVDYNFGTEYLLTAGHCGRYGNGWWNGDGTRRIGNTANDLYLYDLLLIQTDAGNRIFDGGVGSGEFSKGVAFWDWVFGGEWVCTSGSFTGALCNHVVNGFYYTQCYLDIYGEYQCYEGLVRSSQHDGLTAGQPGDSGGPVFGLTGNRVVAKGTITGGYGNVLFWAEFATAWWHLHVLPLTSSY